MFIKKNVKRYKVFNSRKYKRLKAPYLLKYRLHGSMGDVRLANLKDVSSGGLRFYTHESLPKGTSLELNLLIPPDRVVTATAKVLYTRHMSSSFYHVSVCFSEMAQSDQKILAQFIHNIEADEKLSRLIDQPKPVVYREKRPSD